MSKAIPVLVVLLTAATAAATTTVYYDLNKYLAVTPDPGSYKAFSDFEYGIPLHGQTDWEVVLADGAYAFHAHADHGLWSNPGRLSTYDANEPLVFTFENSPNPVITGSSKH